MNIRLTNRHCIRARGLLNMEYRAFEVAEVLGAHVNTVYAVLAVAGIKTRREGRIHWINGQALREWIEREYRARRAGRKLTSTEAFCLPCHKVITAREWKAEGSLQVGRALMLKRVTACPSCGG